MKKELKIALVMDDYKLKNKEDWWARGMKSVPELEKHYNFVREETHPGVTKNTITLIRYFKLKPEFWKDGTDE